MKDRFMAGAVSGFIGAAVQLLYGFAAKATGLADRSFHDFGKVFVMSSHAEGLFTDFIGVISHLSNGAIWGIVFAYIIYLTSSRFYLIKGLIYGTILWHVFFGLGTMFKMPAFDMISANSSFTILIGSIIYGIVTSYVLKILDTTVEVK